MPARPFALLDVMQARADLTRPIPVFLKIADLSDDDLFRHCRSRTRGPSGIIATNTTLSREGLKSAHAGGQAAFPAPCSKSTRVLARLSQLTDGKLPLVGVGGISSEEAYADRAGASTVQLYTAMVYQGLSLAAHIARGLDALARDSCLGGGSRAATAQAGWPAGRAVSDATTPRGGPGACPGGPMRRR